MTYEQTAAFFKLGLSIDSDRLEVKRAYAKKLRTCSPETNPEEWMLLHDAYEKALSAFDVHNSSSGTGFMINEDGNDEDDDSENDYVSFFQDIEQLSSESEAKNKLGYILVKLSSIMTLKLKHRVKHDGTLIVNGIELQKPQKCLSKRKFRLEIPEYINGYPVTEIGETAFSSCYILREIKIPEGVTKIGRLAFSDCISLESIEFPESLITIDDRAFEGCDSLRSVTLPSGLNEVGEKVFAGCIFLKNVRIPSNIDQIAKKIFSSYKFFSGSVYDIGEGFELVDADNCFERVHSIRETEYVFKDNIAGVELEIIDAGRKRLGLTDSMLAKKILAVSPLIPKKVQIERNLEVYRDMIWCVYSFSLETPVEGTLNFFSGLIVSGSHVLHVSSSSQYIYDDPDVERRRNIFGICRLVKSLRPKNKPYHNSFS